MANGSFAYDSTCTKVGTASVTAATVGTAYVVTVSGLSPGTTYFIGIKYSPTAIAGDTVPTGACGGIGPEPNSTKCATYHYDSTNGPPGQNLVLVPNM
jgi:hypothetical protein